MPRDEPLTFEIYGRVVIARRDFLDMIGFSNMTTDLMLGSVRGDSGIMPSWVSVRARYRLILRGSEHVAYRRCEVCGEHIYAASGIGP
jgi:hypothetical protein